MTAKSAISSSTGATRGRGHMVVSNLQFRCDTCAIVLRKCGTGAICRLFKVATFRSRWITIRAKPAQSEPYHRFEDWKDCLKIVSSLHTTLPVSNVVACMLLNAWSESAGLLDVYEVWRGKYWPVISRLYGSTVFTILIPASIARAFPT